ncbi:GDSL-type esterase/lipase family protein [Flavobacterium sp. N2820]|uniref:GDSL-type esterase/lipase family protein n=1 Tax=Flavobacterium sp. N2820 TaxID=2986834 RepID=UPI0022253395|nr:GDSL-type esterase/lipase family protein [Flavobacterium sp. N2820]
MQNDWAYLEKYALDNKHLLKQHNDGNRIVFIGDSITEFWERYDSMFFSQNTYINRGISSQTTSQILERFQKDVIDLQPKSVIILAGINDIAENNGPISIEEIMNNIVSMVEKSLKNNIEVLLCSVLPANNFYWNPKIQPIEKIIQLNQMIKAYSLVKQIKYVDYYTQMVDENLGLDKKYTDDGVHPNLEGYLKMKSIFEFYLK